ncbi:MAG TPA: hypothetical protein VG758_25595 [Hyphomicrobiaceae bacterium]|jgi:hypothetical protein|nr:hypothetical protein [Hyphomicrobiaceae bacterium]
MSIAHGSGWLDLRIGLPVQALGSAARATKIFMPRNRPGPSPFEAKAARFLLIDLPIESGVRRTLREQGTLPDTAVGTQVEDNDAPQGESLEESTREHNSNLQRLIEAIGGLLSASADLLVRLQQILGRGQPDNGATLEPGEPDETQSPNGRQY